MLKNTLSRHNLKKVLDVGCGRGEFVQILKESVTDFEQIVCIDYNEKVQNIIEQRFGDDNRIVFKKMDCCNLDFEDEFFDGVSISNALHELSDIDCVLKQILRVLKKDGVLIVNEMFQDNQSDKQLSHVKVHHFGAKLDTMGGRVHNSTFEKKEILDIINNLPVEIVDEVEYNTHEEQEKEYDGKLDSEYLTKLDNHLTELVEKHKDNDMFDKLMDEKKSIIEYMKENGMYGATELMIVAKKK